MNIQPGWYPDPSGTPNLLRWWDGTQWTGYTAPIPAQTQAQPNMQPQYQSQTQSQEYSQTGSNRPFQDGMQNPSTYQPQNNQKYQYGQYDYNRQQQFTPSYSDTNSQYNSNFRSPETKSMSTLGITGFVIGIVALVTSFIPIVNNFSAILAIVGIPFAIIGIVTCVKGTKKGKAFSIAGLIICVLAFIFVLITQAIYSEAIDDIFGNSVESTTSKSASASASSSASSSSSSSSAASSSSSSTSKKTSHSNLSIGTEATFSSGLTVTVNSVESGLLNYDGRDITCVNVTYRNNGQSNESFNVYDWSGEDSQGARRNFYYYSKAVDELNSGDLAPGGSVTGNIYFESPIAKVVYTENIWVEGEEVTWLVS